MTYRLEFELPGLPRMANLGNKSHWRHAHNEQTRWKSEVAVAVFRHRPKAPLKRARLVLTRFSSTEPDYDGLVRGFKPIVDGLREAGVLADDKLSNTGPWDCRWERAPQRQGRIRVQVIEVLSTEGE